MAKEDFCFTYYDGDAARDKAHMNRLQRGAYDDIISAQRKRGHLTIEDIKRVLSGDFEACWSALEWVLLKDEDSKYFIEWVDTSVKKGKANSKKNKDRIEEYWRKVHAGEIIPKNKNGITKEIPRNNHGIKLDIPLGNEYGNGNNKTEEEVNSFVVPQMHHFFKKENPRYLVDQIPDFISLHSIACKILTWDNIAGQPSDNADHVLKRWKELIPTIKSNSHLRKYSLTQIEKHFQSVIQNFNDNGQNIGSSKQSHPNKPVITGTTQSAGNL